MKPLFIIIILSTAFHCTAQQTPVRKKPVTKQEFQQKSREQRTGAFILLGAGVVAIASVSSGNSGFGATEAIGGIGVLSILGSVPLFIASAKNKHRSRRATASLELEYVPMQLTAKNYPAAALKINF